MCFIDYSKAFDCVSHSKLWTILTQMGFPEHLINLMSKLYIDQESAVRTSCGPSDWFKIGRGVRQGCILSPTLYNLYAENIMREALEDHDWGIKIGGVRRSNLRFADDTTLIAKSREELLEMIAVVKDISRLKGLLLNVKKTKIMVVDNNRTGHADFMLDGEKIDVVDDFIYLGSLIDCDGSSRKEVKRRLTMARSTTINMATIWKSRGISTKLKVRLLQATSFAIASYGCESWALTKSDQSRIDSFELWAYRRVLRVPWTAMKTNRWVLDTIGSGPILRKQMAVRKMRYFGHVVRRNGFEKEIIQGSVEGRRRRGRPATPWSEDFRSWIGCNLAAASSAATDRKGWRMLVRATAALFAPPD